MTGWKTATIQTEKNIKTEIQNALSNREHATNYGDNAFRLPGYEAPIKKTVKQVIKEAELTKGKIAIINANDTTDSGTGTVYRIQSPETVEELSSYKGYEGAMARDVTGQIREEHDINPHAGYI